MKGKIVQNIQNLGDWEPCLYVKGEDYEKDSLDQIQVLFDRDYRADHSMLHRGL